MVKGHNRWLHSAHDLTNGRQSSKKVGLLVLTPNQSRICTILEAQVIPKKTNCLIQQKSLNKKVHKWCVHLRTSLWASLKNNLLNSYHTIKNYVHNSVSAFKLIWLLILKVVQSCNIGFMGMSQTLNLNLLGSASCGLGVSRVPTSLLNLGPSKHH